MRHGKHTFKIGRRGTHRRAMLANMVKSLILNEAVETTVTKAKELRAYADQMITLAKKNTLASRRTAMARLQLRYNALTSKEARLAKKGDTSLFNDDRLVINKLWELKERYATRAGGYTRIIRTEIRVGDNAAKCVVEYV
ncbi:MAG TPA: 50S ribosomal protein L17 [Chlamydiales bacterium]|nr:50S ribosomal protein L17 [Chlamydiales bacterium]